jgi:hypothetical protein
MGRETQHFTSTGLIVGTPEWMSPEQIAGDKLDARSDIYTLGLIAFRMLTGEGAFSGMTSQEVLLSKMTKAPRRLHDVRADVEWPEDLQAAMDKVLATDPNARYDDALMFAADFYAGVSKLPMTPSAEEYYNMLTQRAVTPNRLSTVESTPVRGVPTIETPVPRRAVDVPQLANTTVLPAGAGLHTEAPAATTGSGVGIGTPSGAGVAIPTPVVPVPARKKGRGLMYGVAGIALAVVALAVSQLGGNPAPTPTVSADTGAKTAVATSDSGAPAVGRGPDSAAAARLGGAATPPVTPNSTTVAPAGRALGPALDSVANKNRGSVFTVARGRTRSTAFVVDGDGLLLTSSAAVGPTPIIDVYLDGSRRVAARVVMVDSARGLAALLVQKSHCPTACAPVTIAADRVAFKQGDSVVAMTGGTLVSQGARPKGALTNATAQRLTAALGTGESATGAPVFLPDGNMVGVIRSGGGRSAMLVPASVARAFVREAQAERTSKSLQPVDSLLPSWPARPLAAEEISAGVRRTTKDLDGFRVRGRGDFEALVMTPQILALRKAEADTLRKYFNPGSSTTTFCDGNGPCDPIEAWGGLADYLSERRAVVVIQVAPNKLPPPYRGEHARQDMNRKPGLVRVQLMRGNTEVPQIEQHRIMSVINPNDYPENQRELLYSGLAIYNPNDLLAGGNLELRIYHGGRDPLRLAIPATVVEKIRTDLASVIR